MQQLQPGTLLQGGKYRIERVLGQGGFGITYLATQVALNRQVAIKEFFMENLCDRSASESTSVKTVSVGSVTMVERYKQKFLKEARIIAELRHENIVNIYDVFEENGTAYYVMEYMGGGSLGNIIRQRGHLLEDEAVGYILKVANAVDYIHQRKINHFDIKPDNIMLRSDGTPVLIDFGISKRYDSAGAPTTTTPVGISEGYAPIEQYSADGVLAFSPQTDIYSLGATLLKLLTGETPPSAPSRSGGASLYVPATFRPSTRNAINGAMVISKNERTESVRQFVDALASNKAPIPAHSPKNKLWLWVLIGSLSLVLIILGIISITKSKGGTVPKEPQEDSTPGVVELTDSVAPNYEEEGTVLYDNNSNDIELQGVIGDYPVKVNLTINGGNVTGSYYYLRSGSGARLYLNGTLDDAGWMGLEETNSDGMVTGNFDGTYIKGDGYSGRFVNYLGDEMQFSLTP